MLPRQPRSRHNLLDLQSCTKRVPSIRPSNNIPITFDAASGCIAHSPDPAGHATVHRRETRRAQGAAEGVHEGITSLRHSGSWCGRGSCSEDQPSTINEKRKRGGMDTYFEVDILAAKSGQHAMTHGVSIWLRSHKKVGRSETHAR